MARQGEIRVVGVLGALVVSGLVLALVIALSMMLWSRGDLNQLICDGDCGPSNVIAPHELAIGTAPASFAAPDVPAGEVDSAKLSAAVAEPLDASVLGPRVGFAAIAPDGAALVSRGAGTYIPASTTKVLTGFAALSKIAPGTRYTTSVVRSGDGIVLVGGGDPYLSSKPAKKTDDRVFRADLVTLARRTASALTKSGTTSVSLGFDESLFSGPKASPEWKPSYLAENIVTPVSALWADQGVQDGIRSRDPAKSAARTFAEFLGKRGITVLGEPAPASAQANAVTVGQVRSATVGQIVETLIRVSDNQAAEVMLRHIAIAADKPPTFDGGVAAVRAVLESADIDTAGLKLHDGSGLSRGNRISPQTLVETIRAASSVPRVSGLLADLPVSGFTGTLVNRFAEPASSRGTVRAKTGTLTGVHSLAGYAIDADGRPLLFAVMSDRSDPDLPFQAQAALDQVAAAIAACHCG